MEVVRRLAASLSIISHTSIPYFLSLPIRELFLWVETIEKMQGGR